MRDRVPSPNQATATFDDTRLGCRLHADSATPREEKYTPVTGRRIVEVARSQIGVPFQHQASLRDVACDCIGLVIIVAEAFKMPEAAAFKADARFRGYGVVPVPETLLEACDVYLDRIAVAVATLGDILLFAFQRDPMHFGIISAVDPLYVVHAYQPMDRVVENSLTGKWQRRVIGAYRYRSKV